MRSQFTQTHFQLSVCPPGSPRLLIHLLRSSAVLAVLLASNYFSVLCSGGGGGYSRTSTSSILC